MKRKPNWRKEEALGMSLGKATYRLKKAIMLELLKKLNAATCYRCGLEITKPDELSLDHKQNWLGSKNPVALFFDTTNVAFSHMKCNLTASLATRSYGPRFNPDGSKSQNQTVTVKSSCGYKGVHFDPRKPKKPWSAVVTKDKKRYLRGNSRPPKKPQEPMT